MKPCITGTHRKLKVPPPGEQPLIAVAYAGTIGISLIAVLFQLFKVPEGNIPSTYIILTSETVQSEKMAVELLADQ